MSRTLRPQMPGVAFHITARTQGKEPWFANDVMKTTVERIIFEGVATSDAMFLSHVVMDNHFHIVLRQGARSLGWIMQPIMRRIALRIQRQRGIKGHIFERRFRSHACESADHLRRAIVYSHLNPKKAFMCDDPAAYRWSSHIRLLIDEDQQGCSLQVVHTLKLFGNKPNQTLPELRDAYLRYVDWRMEKDRHLAAGIPFAVPEPETIAGDRHFMDTFCALPPLNHVPQTDLRDKAAEVLRSMNAKVRIDDLRGPYLNRGLSQLRAELIAALLQALYPGKSIANFFRISDSAVSKVASRMRYALLAK